MADGIHIGDVGTDLILSITELDSSGNVVAVDVSSSTTKDIILRKPTPDSTKITLAASFVTDGIDGRIHVLTGSPSIWDTVGFWDIQAFIVLTGSPAPEFFSEIKQFRVYKNL